MGPRRKPLREEEYRKRLWRAVLDALGDKTKADLARLWGKSKSTVNRLETSDLPTTLGNLDAIAAALGLELGDLLWPLVDPVDPDTAQSRFASQAKQAQTALYKRLIDRHMAALMKPDVQELLRLAGLLGMTAPEEVPTVIDMLEGLVERRGAREQIFGVRDEHKKGRRT